MISGSYLGTIYSMNSHDPDSDVRLTLPMRTGTVPVKLIYGVGESIGMEDNEIPEIIEAEGFPAYNILDKKDSWSFHSGTYGGFPIDEDAPGVGFGGYTIFGTKKVSDDVYRTYYGFKTWASVMCFRFKYIEIDLVNGTATDNLIQEIALDRTTSEWARGNHLIIGKTVHVGLIRGFPSIDFPTTFGIYIYHLDMETETVTGGVEWTSTVSGTEEATYFYFLREYETRVNEILAFGSTNGELRWATYYFRTTEPNGDVINIKMVVNGSESTLYTSAGAPDFIGNWGHSTFNSPSSNMDNNRRGNVVQYNSRDFVQSIVFSNINDLLSFRATVDRYGNVSKTSTLYTIFPLRANIDGVPPEAYKSPSFISKTEYPAIVWNQDESKFYNADPDTGVLLGEFVIATASSIENIFPTLDTDDNAIYALATFPSGRKLVGVDLAGTVLKIIPSSMPTIDNSSYGTSYNHGNIFMLYNPSGIGRVWYLISRVVRNEVLMIVEQN